MMGRRRLTAALRWVRSPAARALLGALLAPIIALLVAASFQRIPDALLPAESALATSVRVHDAHGRLVTEVRTREGGLGAPVTLAELPKEVPLAILAAEDQRFYWHPGVDPLAVVRAVGQALWHRRIVSGASTLTQQLVKNVVPRPRTFGAKLREMAIALRVDLHFDKRHILEEYLNRVEFGPNVRGIEAASRLYFDKPAAKLSLSEAAALAAMPRGPTLYDPQRGTTRLTRRRDRVLDRMLDNGFSTRDAVERAKAEPIVLTKGGSEGGAPHFVRAVLSGALQPELIDQKLSEVVTTLDADLQREVSVLARQTRERIASYDASAVSVIVIDNQSGDILSYVGSPDFFDRRSLGQNDGVLALRQPGSTLKPFVYATGMQRMGLGAASILPDVELHLSTPEGDYSPRNYDGRFHGPVRLREALGNSYNVPAVFVAQEAGPAHVLETLHRVGFTALDRAAEHYGAAIALGDGEVTLAELANAYATLARGGLFRPLRAVTRARLARGEQIALPPREEVRVMPAEVAALLTDILSDPKARVAAFGRGNVLELPFPAAVKTGTSKGFRDNWTVGYTRELSVAVWVGNFDGHPMSGSSGVTGAAPLFADVMMAAMRGRKTEPLVAPGVLEELEVCALSGELPGPHCSQRIRERFVPGRGVHSHCDLHVEVAIDPNNGLRAGAACAAARPEIRERYPDRFTAWAAATGRPVVPDAWSPRCPGQDVRLDSAPARLAFPFEGARFVRDPGLPARAQAIVLRARVAAGGSSVRFVVDGKSVGSSGAPFAVSWPLVIGRHEVRVASARGELSEPVRFVVE